MTIQVREDNNNEPFVLDATAEHRDLTLAADQGDVTIGTVLGELSATPGTYAVTDITSMDGSEFPKRILTAALEDDSSPTTGLQGYVGGLFDENQLVFGGTTDLDSKLNNEFMPNLVDRDFSGASAWENVDVNAYDETGDLTLTASAADQYVTLPVLSMPTVIGQEYDLFFDVDTLVESWEIQDFTGAQVLGVISADQVQGKITFIATTTGGLRIAALATTSSANFDNFSLKRAGANANTTMRDILRALNIRLAPGISETGYENS